MASAEIHKSMIHHLKSSMLSAILKHCCSLCMFLCRIIIEHMVDMHLRPNNEGDKQKQICDLPTRVRLSWHGESSLYISRFEV